MRRQEYLRRVRRDEDDARARAATKALKPPLIFSDAAVDAAYEYWKSTEPKPKTSS